MKFFSKSISKLSKSKSTHKCQSANNKGRFNREEFKKRVNLPNCSILANLESIKSFLFQKNASLLVISVVIVVFLLAAVIYFVLLPFTIYIPSNLEDEKSGLDIFSPEDFLYGLAAALTQKQNRKKIEPKIDLNIVNEPESKTKSFLFG